MQVLRLTRGDGQRLMVVADKVLTIESNVESPFGGASTCVTLLGNMRAWVADSDEEIANMLAEITECAS